MNIDNEISIKGHNICDSKIYFLYLIFHYSIMRVREGGRREWKVHGTT